MDNLHLNNRPALNQYKIFGKRKIKKKIENKRN